ncbi:MAG: hydroxymethylglutaryl-CoA lyase [Fimbriimonadaceae bacterium]|nr:hydroxymethylglutaryl-CoA lyase [Fimbriimonadaceae bacterium]QYK57601.1 MAG: hydroxymethylglutaryl-CoA lyase [Fimbriimonadaceae bacterium]
MVRIIEVGPRDGLQNEKLTVPTGLKARFVALLAEAGLQEIEATSFVSPKWVPQLGDAAELWAQLPAGTLFSALVPNLKGLERALECGVDRIAVFTAASDAFTHKNINMSIEESLAVFGEILTVFRSARPSGWARGYVSTAFECPYAGRIDPEATAGVVGRLAALGVDEVSIGDTIGAAAPKEVRALHEVLGVEPSKVAWHFHDTRGTAVANVAQAIELGYRAFDASAGGLGGCPYAPGAGGNLATEDLVYFLERSGIATGIDQHRLARASLEVLRHLGREPRSKAQSAILASCE